MGLLYLFAYQQTFSRKKHKKLCLIVEPKGQPVLWAKLIQKYLGGQNLCFAPKLLIIQQLKDQQQGCMAKTSTKVKRQGSQTIKTSQKESEQASQLNDKLENDESKSQLNSSMNHSAQRNKHKSNVFRVDKILGERVKNGVVEVLVSWHGYTKFCNRWVLKSSVYELTEEQDQSTPLSNLQKPQPSDQKQKKVQTKVKRIKKNEKFQQQKDINQCANNNENSLRYNQKQQHQKQPSHSQNKKQNQQDLFPKKEPEVFIRGLYLFTMDTGVKWTEKQMEILKIYYPRYLEEYLQKLNEKIKQREAKQNSILNSTQCSNTDQSVQNSGSDKTNGQQMTPSCGLNSLRKQESSKYIELD